MTGMKPETGELKVTSFTDCGNAPRKQLLLAFNVAFAKGDIAFILEHVANDIVWDRVGDDRIEGKERLAETIEQMKDNLPTEIRIANIITHGSTAAANGILSYEQKRYSYCDIYIFNGAAKSAKIIAITTYAIDVS